MKKLLVLLALFTALAFANAGSASAHNTYGWVKWSPTSGCSTCYGIGQQVAHAGCTTGATLFQSHTNVNWLFSSSFPYDWYPCPYVVFGRSETSVQGCYYYTDMFGPVYMANQDINAGVLILNHRACMTSALPAVAIQ